MNFFRMEGIIEPHPWFERGDSSNWDEKPCCLFPLPNHAASAKYGANYSNNYLNPN